MVELALDAHLREFRNKDPKAAIQDFSTYIDKLCEGKRFPRWREFFDEDNFSPVELDTIRLLMDGTLTCAVEIPWQYEHINEHKFLRAMEESLTHLLAEKGLPYMFETQTILAMRHLSTGYVESKLKFLWDVIIRDGEFVPLDLHDRISLVKIFALIHLLEMEFSLDTEQLSTIMVWKMQLDS